MDVPLYATFSVLTSTGLTGVFDSVLGVLQDGFSFAVTYTSTDVQVITALHGDLNLDGLVNASDETVINANLGLAGDVDAR